MKLEQPMKSDDAAGLTRVLTKVSWRSKKAVEVDSSRLESLKDLSEARFAVRWRR